MRRRRLPGLAHLYRGLHIERQRSASYSTLIHRDGTPQAIFPAMVKMSRGEPAAVASEPNGSLFVRSENDIDTDFSAR